MKHKCPREECGYEWEARVRNPKQCPMCKRYLPLVEYQNKLKKRNKEEQNENEESKRI